MSNTATQSFGERAVGLSFNPSGDPLVEKLKSAGAVVIDLCHAPREASSDPELKRRYSVAITDVQAGQMWTVKAATWR